MKFIAIRDKLDHANKQAQNQTLIEYFALESSHSVQDTNVCEREKNVHVRTVYFFSNFDSYCAEKHVVLCQTGIFMVIA